MAINLATRYPGRANPADTNYPQGSFKNRSAPGVLDGSYLEKDWANDFFAFFQQSLVEAGISPNDTVDNATNSQYYQALKSVFAEKTDFLSIATTAFEASVTDGDAVYWDSANSRFDEAIADGTNKQNMIGFADVTNGRVILMGAYSGQLIGLTPGAKYYLSGTVAGAITSSAPATNIVQVGIAKELTEILIDIDAAGGITQAQADARYVGIGYMLIQDQKAAGVDAGAAVVGVQTRTLNTVVRNTIVGASLSSNQITLPAGTYRIRAFATSAEGQLHQAWLRNVTDSTVAIVGSNEFNYNATPFQSSRSEIVGTITIASTKLFSIQHYFLASTTSTGLGKGNASGQIGVFSSIEIIKES